MTNVVQAILFCLASLVMGACIIFVPESAKVVSVSYITVMSVYLGVDIAEMISKTATMAKGEYKELRVHKYVVSAICLLALIISALIMKDKADMETTLTTLISASMIIFGCILGGLQGNKIATNVDGTSNV